MVPIPCFSSTFKPQARRLGSGKPSTPRTCSDLGRKNSGSAMGKLDGVAVAKLLAEYGRRSALRGGNPYRARAYRQAAENILALTEPLETLIAEGRVREIPGVGDAIADIVTTLHKTGTHPTLERM